MKTHSIFDFYNFIQNIAISSAAGLGIVLFFCSLTLLNYKTTKAELIFFIITVFLFFTCLFFSIYLNYLQIR